MKLIPAVNFINVFRALFSYECRFGSVFLLTYVRTYVEKKLPKRHSYEKSAQKTLMKLTPGLNFIIIVQAAFAQFDLLWSYSYRAGVSNSNYLAGRKCNKNLQKGRKSVQKVLSGPNFTKNNDWKSLFTSLITCFRTLSYAFRLTEWNNRQKSK